MAILSQSPKLDSILYQFRNGPASARPTGLETPVQYLKGAGPRKAELLGRLGLHTLHDLLLYFPRHHEDRRCLEALSRFPEAGKAAIRGRVVRAGTLRLGKNLVAMRAVLRDDTGAVEAVWFKRFSYQYDVFTHLKKILIPGSEVRAYGAAGGSKGRREIRVEAYEPAQEGPEPSLHFDRLVPVYGLTHGLEERWMREFMWRHVSAHALSLSDPLPRDLKSRQGLPDLDRCLKTYHFPERPEDLEAARRRLAFEELLFLEVAMGLSRRLRRSVPKPRPCLPTRGLLSPFKERLGFEFTGAQGRAINQIFRDMAAPEPMNRLLQGDVGSGKTAVAAAAVLLAAENGLQSAVIAPTEILAQQHAATFSRWFEPLGVSCACLTGSVPEAGRRTLREDLASGRLTLITGTHALLEEEVRFKALGLVVIDEQHRFGVRQRLALAKKGGDPPDVLIMTATPIPRTLALTFFADLDVSVLDELPPGRKPVETVAVDEAEAHARLKRELAAGGQGYYIFPLVEESEGLAAQGKAVKAAKREFTRLAKEIFPEFRLGLLHGQMPSREKAAAMEAFRKGEVRLLVATTVIEVGVDVPNANILAIVHPERFGLAQLHQLRGRIGRGTAPGTCLVILPPQDELVAVSPRLDVFCRTTDGFRLAEEDLKIRGPGEFLGIAQHGEAPLRVARIVTDGELIGLARKEAEALLAGRPGRGSEGVFREVRRRFHKLIDFGKVG